MGDIALQTLRMGRAVVRVDGRAHNDGIAVLGGIAVHFPDHAEDGALLFLGVGHGLDDVGRDAALGVSAADREDEKGVISAEIPDLHLVHEDPGPALVIGDGGEGRHIVREANGLDASALEKVAGGVSAVSGAPADSAEEQSSFLDAEVIEDAHHMLQGVDLVDHFLGDLLHFQKAVQKKLSFCFFHLDISFGLGESYSQ